MYVACHQGHLACVQLLSSCGARRRWALADGTHDTAENQATFHGHRDVVAWLNLDGRMVNCAHCQKELVREEAKKCGMCKERHTPNAAYYCDKKCAKTHWKAEHKSWHESSAN